MASRRIIQIPIELIIEILAWSPAKSVLRFKSVCKEWYNLIDRPVFINLHLHKTLEPNSRHNRFLFCTRSLRIVVDEIHHLKITNQLDKLDLPHEDNTLRDRTRIYVGSCNGLVCFTLFHRRRHIDVCFVICNLTTRTFKSIVPPHSEKKWKHDDFTYGFGYDSEHDDYKIVVTNHMFLDDVRLYSLKADSWSFFPTDNNSPTRARGRVHCVHKGVFANKTLHFLVRSSLGGYGMARFDVCSERWNDEDLSVPNPSMKWVRFGPLDGWVYLCDVDSGEVWIMDEYGSWKLPFHLPEDLCCYYDYIIARFKNGGGGDGGRSLLLQRDVYVDGGRLLLQRHDDHNYRQDNDVIPVEIEWNRDEGKLDSCIASLVTIPGCSSTSLQQIDEYLNSMVLDNSLYE